MLVEASPEREMQIDALYQPLRLHSQQRDPCRIERELLLLHSAQIDRADAEADIRKLERTRVLSHCASKDFLALRRGEACGKRAFDLSEYALADLAVFGDCRLLLGGAHVHLGLQQTAKEERLYQSRSGAEQRIVAILQHKQLG